MTSVASSYERTLGRLGFLFVSLTFAASTSFGLHSGNLGYRPMDLAVDILTLSIMQVTLSS
jgi:hypothetical protein